MFFCYFSKSEAKLEMFLWKATFFVYQYITYRVGISAIRWRPLELEILVS